MLHKTSVAGVASIPAPQGGRHRGHRSSQLASCNSAQLNEALLQVPLKNRTTQRSAAAQLGIPQQTLQKNLGMRSSTRFLKPYLTGEGKARRLAWALRWVREGHGGSRTFDTMDNVVMADENWFFIKKTGPEIHPG